ncbi:MAG: hypothetical protein WC759_04530, partial [Candidatus Micrarchaeia archaeon]
MGGRLAPASIARNTGRSGSNDYFLRCAELLGGGPILIPKSRGRGSRAAYEPDLEMAGVRRMLLEMGGRISKRTAISRLRKYERLVCDIAEAVASELGFLGNKMVELTEEQERSMFGAIWREMHQAPRIVYGADKYGFLYSAVGTMKLDCDNQAFLVYDVMRKLKVRGAKIVLASVHRHGDHALVKGKWLYFEPTNNKVPMMGRESKRTQFYQELSWKRKIDALAAATCGWYFMDIRDYGGAIACFELAFRENVDLRMMREKIEKACKRLAEGARSGRRFEEELEAYSKLMELLPSPEVK